MVVFSRLKKLRLDRDYPQDYMSLLLFPKRKLRKPVGCKRLTDVTTEFYFYSYQLKMSENLIFGYFEEVYVEIEHWLTLSEFSDNFELQTLIYKEKGEWLFI